VRWGAVKKVGSAKSKTIVKIILLITLILFYSATPYAEATTPLGNKGTKQRGINFGYGYPLESNADLRFASIYPYFGKVMTGPVGRDDSREILKESSKEHSATYLKTRTRIPLELVFMPAITSFFLLKSGGHIYREALEYCTQI
jgi:hypothetical protein